MFRPIAISLSPNTEADDVFLALKLMFMPWKWFENAPVKKLEESFASYFGPKYKALAVNSGRSGMYLILKALGISEGDEVAVQGFTCVAVPNSVLWLGARPLYIDIDRNYNLDMLDLEKKVSRRTKAIVVQHSFGVPADIKEIKKLGLKRGIPVIEDCAVSLGAESGGSKVGTFGKAAFFSFGRDKIISSVFGGMVLCSDEDFYSKLYNEREKLPESSKFWVWQQLFHPVAFSIILPLYRFGLGKFILFGFQKLGLLSRAVYEAEKNGGKPAAFPAKMPGALATLALNQFAKLKRFNNKRVKIAEYYAKNLPFKLTPLNKGAVWLRFPILLKKARDFYNFTKQHGALLGDWYKEPVVPVYKMDKVYYKKGMCPNAERMAGEIVNLPTYPLMTEGDVDIVVKLVKKWLT